MILRLTVHNNNLTKSLLSFAKSLHLCENGDIDANIDNPILSVIKGNARYEYLKALVAQNKANDVDIGIFRDIIKKRFQYFCTEFQFANFDERTQKYMIENFDVQIVRSVMHVNENQEVVYVFLDPVNNYSQTVIL